MPKRVGIFGGVYQAVGSKPPRRFRIVKRDQAFMSPATGNFGLGRVVPLEPLNQSARLEVRRSPGSARPSTMVP